MCPNEAANAVKIQHEIAVTSTQKAAAAYDEALKKRAEAESEIINRKA